jgi:hypothetical protein
VIFNLTEKQESYDLRVYFQRVALVQTVLVLTIIFPDINLVLSLFTGSICGTLYFVLPVFFHRQAYISIPSKKDRTMEFVLGYLVVGLAVPIGIMGIV